MLYIYRLPEVDRTCKPFIDHFTSTGEAGLKTVFVPDELVPLFLHCAMANSVQSIETCGILCGKLVCIAAAYEIFSNAVIILFCIDWFIIMLCTYLIETVP